MQVSYAPAFLRLLKKLDPHVKEAAKTATAKVIDFYESGQRTSGLGIKHLRADIWEARAGLRIRVLYRLSDDRLHFILAGTHDDVKNFLKGS